MPRQTISAVPDRRPLTLAIVLDTSEAASYAYWADVVPAASALLRELPLGTRYAVWGTSDRPTKLVD